MTCGEGEISLKMSALQLLQFGSEDVLNIFSQRMTELLNSSVGYKGVLEQPFGYMWSFSYEVKIYYHHPQKTISSLTSLVGTLSHTCITTIQYCIQGSTLCVVQYSALQFSFVKVSSVQYSTGWNAVTAAAINRQQGPATSYRCK